MLREIHRYEGTVNHPGDGPWRSRRSIAHEMHSAATRRTRMQRRSRGTATSSRGRAAIDFRVRMGLNTGLVVVGAIGDNLRMDYTAVGDTTNTAARMQQSPSPADRVARPARS